MTYLQAIFIFSFLVLLSCYFAYPAVFYLLCRFRKAEAAAGQPADPLPAAALIISICNEGEDVIRATYRNRLDLDYPAGRLELIFVVDGLSEVAKGVINTGEVESNKHRVILFETGERLGKTAALNQVLPQVNAEVVVFSDANSLYRSDAVKKLVGHFTDAGVGGVCGELQYVDEKVSDMTGPVSGIYMRYERFIKMAESRVSTLTVYNGAIYALRHLIHREMNPQAANDFQHPAQVVLRGFRSVYEPEAIAYEGMVKSELVEFRRTIRITARGWKGFFTYPALVNPFVTGFFSLQFIFRKLLRWLSPVFMLAMLISSFLLREQALYFAFFMMQTVFYGTAIGGWLVRRAGLPKIFYFPFYFCLLNLAALLGLLKFLAGQDTATWKPTTEPAKNTTTNSTGNR